MNIPEWMILFVPRYQKDIEVLKEWDIIRDVITEYKWKTYQKKYICGNRKRVSAIDSRYWSLLIGYGPFEIEKKLYFWEEYIIDRMSLRQRIKYYFSNHKL